MIKTAEHFIQTPSSRSRMQERLIRDWKRFTATILVYIVTVVISAWVGSIGEYNLAGDSINGFALWFLLLPGYLPVSLLGFVCWCSGVSLPWDGNEAWLLGACDIVQVLIFYAIVSWRAFSRRKPSTFENSKNFIRILIFWGIFQLCCCAIHGVWQNGGISGLHNCQVSVKQGQR